MKACLRFWWFSDEFRLYHFFTFLVSFTNEHHQTQKTCIVHHMMVMQFIIYFRWYTSTPWHYILVFHRYTEGAGRLKPMKGNRLKSIFLFWPKIAFTFLFANSIELFGSYMKPLDTISGTYPWYFCVNMYVVIYKVRRSLLLCVRLYATWCHVMSFLILTQVITKKSEWENKLCVSW